MLNANALRASMVENNCSVRELAEICGLKPKAFYQRLTEKLACTQILDYAKTFFQDPKNQQAFQVWLKSKEERQNGNDQS